MAFNKPADQGTIDERDAAPAARHRKQAAKAMRWREALEAFDKQQLILEYEITAEDLE